MHQRLLGKILPAVALIGSDLLVHGYSGLSAPLKTHFTLIPALSARTNTMQPLLGVSELRKFL